MKQKEMIHDLVNIVGRQAVLYTPEDLLVYEYDGSFETHPPDVVVLPRTTEEVSQIAKVAARYEVPLVARGAGTGLAGSAIALKGGILIVLGLKLPEMKDSSMCCGSAGTYNITQPYKI